jgi:hypothetical protein
VRDKAHAGGQRGKQVAVWMKLFGMQRHVPAREQAGMLKKKSG